MKALTLGGFFLRSLFTFCVVGLSYNPSGYSYAHWFYNTFKDFGPLLALAGISLVIGWVIILRATLRSLGFIGLTLATVFFACVIWLCFDMGWLSFKSPGLVTWIIEVALVIVLSLGLSWSHIRRRISGQIDMDDVEDDN